MTTEENKLKEKITDLRNRSIEIKAELDKLMSTCEHSFIWGCQGDTMVFCEICNRDATDIFPNMAYKHIEKLVKDDK